MLKQDSGTFKCKICGEKFVSLEELLHHIEQEHADEIPKDFTVSQFYYSLKTGKVAGQCVIDKRPTAWNDSTMKYNRFCDNPKCKEKYREQFKKNMIGVHNKVHLLSEPDQQRKMLANRSISGKYTWSDGTAIPYTGTYELDFLKFLDVFMDFDSSDIMAPSPHTYYYMYEGEKKFYIPDFFIPSLNLEIEIKDGGMNPNNHHKIQDVDKKKEKLKDEVLTSQKAFSYIKLVDKQYDTFFHYMMLLKQQYAEGEPEKPIFLLGDEQHPSVVTESLSEKFKDLHPVYIFLTFTETNLSKAIRFVTGDPYSHSSISFDPSMTNMFSFGRKFSHDKKGALINENIHEGVLKDAAGRDGTYSLYVTFVDSEQFQRMQKRVDELKARAKELVYSNVGLFNYAIGKETTDENKFFCSQFVADILRTGRPDDIKKHPSLYSPYDFTRVRNTFFVARGRLKNYNGKNIEQKVEELRKKIEDRASLQSLRETEKKLV